MKKSSAILFILISFHLSAQLNPEKLKIGIVSGYAFYQQSDLKTINQAMLTQLPFESQMVDNFEPVLYFGGFMQYELLRNFHVGPSYEYHSSGSRLGARDYSGQYSLDQYINSHQTGLKFDYPIISLPLFLLTAQMNGGASFTDWRIVSNLDVGEERDYLEHSQEKFNGHSWYISPGLSTYFQFTKNVYLTGNLTYAFDIARKYEYQYYRDYEVVSSPCWSGPKISLGITYIPLNPIGNRGEVATNRYR